MYYFLKIFFSTVNLIRSSYPNLLFFIGGDFNCRISNFNSLDDNVFFCITRLFSLTVQQKIIINVKEEKFCQNLWKLTIFLCVTAVQSVILQLNLHIVPP